MTWATNVAKIMGKKRRVHDAVPEGFSTIAQMMAESGYSHSRVSLRAREAVAAGDAEVVDVHGENGRLILAYKWIGQ